MMKPASALVATPLNARIATSRLSASLVRFRDDESGTMAVFILFIFLIMIMFGGIAVDVMRFETRRVALQQTLDRAALAAASMQQSISAQTVAQDWFEKADLQQDLAMVTFSDPVIDSFTSITSRSVTISAQVRSYNFFMGILSDNEYLETAMQTQAAQGAVITELMFVLDISGSMSKGAGMTNDPATPVNEASFSRLRAIKAAVAEFVDYLELNDVNDVVSYGVVPFSSQVNIPTALMNQFNVTHRPVSAVLDRNCLEFPESSFNTTAFPLTTPIPVAAVADIDNTKANKSNNAYYPPDAPYLVGPLPPHLIEANDDAGDIADKEEDLKDDIICLSDEETATTPWADGPVNQLLLPTKDGEAVKTKVNRLADRGATYTLMGMRWATALLDQAARPIYTNIGDASVQGRPANNRSSVTRKVIILMTDGDQTNKSHVRDQFKAGPSPIYRGADGNYAIRFINPPSPATPIRPGSALSPTGRSCSGWVLSNYANREYFVPHLKRTQVARENADPGINDPEGVGTGSLTTGACDPQAWVAPPAVGVEWWPGSGLLLTQLDWSEVWQQTTVDWVLQQLYTRANVNVSTPSMRKTFLGGGLSGDAAEDYKDQLLLDNCAAARNAGIEIYGIAFSNEVSPEGREVIEACSSFPKDNYYFYAANGNALMSAFRAIADDISDLRLTQ